MSQTEGNVVREGENVRSMDVADLLAAIAMDDQDHDLADAALGELHCRWGARVDELCKRLTMTYPGKLVGWQPLATELWDWIWSSADKFTSMGATGDALDGRFYRWIENSARCRMIDMARQQGRAALAELPSDASIRAEAEAEVDGDDDGIRRSRPKIIGIFSPPAPGTPDATAEVALFSRHPIETREAIECLRALSPKDQAVLQASAPFLKIGEREVSIPKPDHDSIVAAFNTTVLGLRALRSRAFKKVDTCMKTKARKRTGGA